MKSTISVFLFFVGNLVGGESFFLVEKVSIWHRDFLARYAGRISGSDLMRPKAFNYIVSDGISRFHDISENVRHIEKHMKTGLDRRKIPEVDTVMICEIKLGKGAAYFYVSDDGNARWIDDGEPAVDRAVLRRTLLCLPVAEFIDFLETFPKVKTQCFPTMDLPAFRAAVSYSRGVPGRAKKESGGD